MDDDDVVEHVDDGHDEEEVVEDVLYDVGAEVDDDVPCGEEEAEDAYHGEEVGDVCEDDLKELCDNVYSTDSASDIQILL